ncbi:hypothetical protein AURDEDRAFT_89765 [Auricularia subglabra TFB-10046 SS5]|nr:hypothetical protein AURDEDRAFT_89765 [Auricularia subglabra TFB-10046 SS5]
MTATAPSIVNVHTPTTSFAVIHSLHEDTLETLFNTLSRKANIGTGGARVGPGWLKYAWNDSIWNLDDAADYSILVFRLTGRLPQPTGAQASTSSAPAAAAPEHEASPSPTLHMHNPKEPLPEPGTGYTNPAYYVFAQPALSPLRPPSRAKSVRSVATSRRSRRTTGDDPESSGITLFKKQFQDFHAENGVRTVFGSIGNVPNVRMLLKTGYRHVYMSRTFAMMNGFVPANATPGYYGYGGLVNIGTWPITVGRKTTALPVYLSEETHFDVVLGRSFMERRAVKTDPTDPTNVIFGDTGEKVDVEVVIIRDGKGEIVTVT